MTEGFYLSYNAGDLDAELWEGQNAMLKDIMMQAGVVSAWNNRKHWYSKSFSNYVDSVTRAGEGRQMFPGASS